MDIYHTYRTLTPMKIKQSWIILEMVKHLWYKRWQKIPNPQIHYIGIEWQTTEYFWYTSEAAWNQQMSLKNDYVKKKKKKWEFLWKWVKKAVKTTEWQHCWKIQLNMKEKVLKISWLTQHNCFRERLRIIKRNQVISG